MDLQVLFVRRSAVEGRCDGDVRALLSQKQMSTSNWTALTSLANVSWAFAKYAQPGADERDLFASIRPHTMNVQNFAG